ncbi:rRNA maturation RNase YbeY [Subsaxibacter sp. CAU 1640]|uniref:rRNA maturation RNase YbeY n=1 Tax=Subsaxibacter sp. CAU 1640 TaxID=2933271 RepID=UPI0020039931|nr:rRNA maturation RNase YbeY [Subsaxibacter sp. CAU 1640]MCK7589501.1 rRNA maturation RNase YbeY [Subsaxibacter sp. CAU 1640]
MISYNYECDFELKNDEKYSLWLSSVIKEEGFNEGEINYIFCDDEYLLKLNKEFLQHETLTDIISFDYTLGKQINGDIYISVERVKENAEEFNEPFLNELSRVMVHGVLHYCGFKDKSKEDEQLMRLKENYYISKIA